MQKPRVKICCISSLAEAELAIRYGASALGLVSQMPSGPGVVEEELIAEIAARTPPGVATFLLTSKSDVGEIIEQHQRCRTNTIQIVDYLERGSHEELRRALPGIGLVQVIHVNDEDALAEAQRVAPFVDAILLDSGNQKLSVKELGGTGRTHNWNISRQIVQNAGRPVYLAGGLKPGNVGEAIEKVAPFGLDLCSGVRRNDRLDEELLAAFMEQVNQTGKIA